MAHYQENKFVDIVRDSFPLFFQDKRVLEIGSWDVNGSVRDKFINCDYIGVDISPGQGVDIVHEGQNLAFPTNHFDTVISCECFEHNRYWLETFANMIRMLKPGGLCIVSCATIGRTEHGTRRRERHSSLTAELYSEDYYVNLDKNDFLKRINLSNHFKEYKFFKNIFFLDLYFIGIKKDSSYPDDLEKSFLNISEKVKEITTENDATLRKIISKKVKFFQKYVSAKLLGEKRYHDINYRLEIFSKKMFGVKSNDYKHDKISVEREQNNLNKIKISGATFGRNLIEMDYPVVEAITSILPIVDEFVVNVGKSDDETLKLIQSINDPKIKIIESVWDDRLRKDGLIFSQQANIAISACKGDWIFYINADEVIHEKDRSVILKSVNQIHSNKNILGLMFRYRHFFGDYWSINPWCYRKEIRMIRNDGSVRPCGDMSGFESVSDGRYLKSGPKKRWAFSGATIYHYGWVKKSSRILQERNRRLASFYDQETIAKYSQADEYDFGEYDILKEFRESHPETMQNRVSQFKRLRPRINRWLNWKFYREILKHGYKG